MKKWGALLLVLAMAVTLTACKPKDPEQDAKTVVATVNGTNILKGDAQKTYDFMIHQYVSYYQQYYGSTVDPADKELVTQVKTSTLNALAEQLALEQKLQSLGAGLTEEELAQLESDSVAEYNNAVQSFLEANSLTEEEAKAEADAQGFTLDFVRFEHRNEKIEEKIRAIAAVTVTDEEVKTRYDELVAQAQSAYESTPGQFGSDVTGGKTIYVRPEGYRYIQNLVIGIPEETMAQITEKSNELNAVWYYQYMTQNQLDTQTDLDAETKKTYEDLLASYDEDYKRLEGEIETLKQQGLSQIREKAEEVLALSKAEGADFDAIMKEHNTDTATGDLLTRGYPVSAGSTNYVESFTQGAMALAKIGDVSGLVESTYGYHILKYTGDVEPGVVPLEDVKDVVSQDVLTTKQSEAVTALRSEWIGEAKIKTYISRF